MMMSDAVCVQRRLSGSDGTRPRKARGYPGRWQPPGSPPSPTSPTPAPQWGNGCEMQDSAPRSPSPKAPNPQVSNPAGTHQNPAPSPAPCCAGHAERALFHVSPAPWGSLSPQGTRPPRTEPAPASHDAQQLCSPPSTAARKTASKKLSLNTVF